MSKLSFELILAVVFPIVLFLLDKGGKNTMVVTIILITAATGCLILAALQIPWIWSSGHTVINYWRAALAIVIILLISSRFGIWIWPKTSEELFTQNFPGISLRALITLNDISENRRKYLFDLGQVNGSRLSIYISSDNVFTFLFIDARSEPHPIQIPIGSNGIPFRKSFYLICELGVDGQSTLLRMLIDGKEIKTIKLPFKVDLGGIDVPGGVIGGDLNGENGASFSMGNVMILPTTMTSTQIAAVTKMFLDYYQSAKRNYMEFRGKQWMHIKDLSPIK